MSITDFKKVKVIQDVPLAVRRSEDGYDFPTKGTYRLLTIFINIIYDGIYTSYNPNINNSWWPINNIEGINLLQPTQYFDDVFDVNDSMPRSGYFTRYFSDCSFDSLVLISDFTSVEIKASRINSGNGSFGFQKIANSTLKFISDNGGLQAKYGHNSISDYDRVSGINNTTNNKIDYVVFMVRNPSIDLHGFQYGSGYERWRLGWQSPTNLPYKIAATGINSEINQKFSGTQTYYLRDYITFGDAIRIKLPYKDNAASSSQYIWLENHQIGRNQKTDVDVFQYSTFPGLTCVPKGNPGIFSYIQVGKDVIENANPSLVYPSNETDNLRMINAEGNYNMTYYGTFNDCAGWAGRRTFEYQTSNALSGSNDQTEILSFNTVNSTIQMFSDFSKMESKLKNSVHYNQFPSGGDNFDSFESGRIMDISSNPTPVNAITFYSKYYYSGRDSNNKPIPFHTKVDDNRDTRKKYLTGLSVKMTEDGSNDYGSIFKVEIRWDDYDVKQDVYWTGDIVLKEQLNLLSDKKIVLEQNLTPSQIDKDAISGVFSETTFFSCEPNSEMNLESNSELRLKDKSSFIMYENSSLALQEKAVFVIESGSTLYLKSGSQLELNGHSRIIVKSGAYICMEAGANINLQDFKSLIVLEEGAIIGANPLLFPNANCSDFITAGAGAIVDYSQDVYIQDETISSDRYIGGKNIYVGRNVTTSKPEGDVVIDNTSTVIFDCKNLNISIGFECKPNSNIETIIRN